MKPRVSGESTIHGTLEVIHAAGLDKNFPIQVVFKRDDEINIRECLRLYVQYTCYKNTFVEVMDCKNAPI